MDHHKVSSTLYSAAYYIKLQDAYASEANKYGTWKSIGYVAPGAAAAGSSGQTTNFDYSGAITEDNDVTAANNTEGWLADNRVALNDCAINAGDWKIALTAQTNGNSLKYTATTSCSELTPSFTKIGQ